MNLNGLHVTTEGHHAPLIQDSLKTRMKTQTGSGALEDKLECLLQAMEAICNYMDKYCHNMVDKRWIETLKHYAKSVAVNHKASLVRDARALRHRFPVLLEFLFWMIRDPSGLKGIPVVLSLFLSGSLPSVLQLLLDVTRCLIACDVI